MVLFIIAWIFNFHVCYKQYLPVKILNPQQYSKKKAKVLFDLLPTGHSAS